MSVYLSPIAQDQQLDSNGNPLVGGYWEVYAAGTTTPVTTYTSSTGLTPQAAQIFLDASGRPSNPIWLTGGTPVKFRLYSPLGVILATIDNVSGINDPSGAAVALSEWLASGFTPTYLSATSFSVPGDQTASLQVGRRIRTTNTGGTIYSTITASVYGAVTTVTVANDSGTLDAGLSVLAYGILSVTNPSNPSLGVAQSWTAFTDVTRAVATTYYNTTGRPIQVAWSVTSSAASAIGVFSIGSVNTYGNTAVSAGNISAGSAVVPPGAAYLLTVNSGTPTWHSFNELR
jgi:hypothetical protein